MRTVINLFPRPDKTASEQVLYFGIHYLRHVLVITQFVAVCVFFYRFRVDQEIVDLKEKIYQKDSIVKQTESLIASVEELDLKIKNAKQVLGIQSKLDGNFSYILSKISDKVVINSVEIEGLSVKLEGSAQTAESIRAFNDVIKSENKYKKVVLSNIVRDAEAFKFSMTLEDFK